MDNSFELDNIKINLCINACVTTCNINKIIDTNKLEKVYRKLFTELNNSSQDKNILIKIWIKYLNDSCINFLNILDECEQFINNQNKQSIDINNDNIHMIQSISLMKLMNII